MPYKSDKQRRLVKCVQSGGCKGAGLTKAAADKFAKHAADGGRVKPTGSAGGAAPTIATSARHYADGGKVTAGNNPLIREMREQSARRTASRKARQDAAKKSRAQSRAIAATEQANRAAAKRRARRAAPAAAARPTGGVTQTRSTTRTTKPKTAQRRPQAASRSATPPKPALEARKPLAKVTVTSRRPAGGGGPAARKGGSAGDKAKTSVRQRLRKMNKAAVKRATGHRSEDDSR